MNRRNDIDFDASRAILLATSTYKPTSKILTPLPAAARSLAEMRELLIDTCEWPSNRITSLPERRHGGLLPKITKLIENVDDVLLFYYAGHGLPIPQDGRYDLGLGLADTDEAASLRSSTSLRVRDLREQMEASRARVKILILDCCNAGIATHYADQISSRGAPSPAAGVKRSGGTYIWAACGHAQETYFEKQDGGLTYFTKFLAEAVRDARELPPPGADIADLNDEVARRFEQAAESAEFFDVPGPEVHHSGRPDGFRFVRSRGAAYFVPPHRFEKLEAEDPKKVGPYTLRARLGSGGVGRVYLATGKQGEPVAVKVLHPEYGRDPAFASLFAAESLLARRIRSRFVARMLEAEPTGARPWLAMAYVCGPSLQELVAQVGPLPPRDILKIAAGVAQALEAVHATDTVHRDLKPANIMVDETGPKIIDFGIAKSVAATKAATTHRNLGTPAYKSPEQIMGKKVTGKSDVFSLGSTLYFLATGRNAFQPEEEGELVAYTHLICFTEPDSSGIDGDVRRLIEACLAKDPGRRPDPAKLIAMCRTALGELTTDAPLPIDAAGGPVRARAQALRALLTAPEKPTIVVGGGGGTTEEVRGGNGGNGGKGGNPKPPGGAGVRALLTAAATLLLIVAVAWLPSHWHSLVETSANGPGNPSSSPAAQALYSQDVSQNGPPDDGQTTTQPAPPDSPSAAASSDEPSPTPATSSAPDLWQSAQAGECFANSGSFAKPILQQASCTSGNFRAVSVLTGTTDNSGCSNARNVDYRATSFSDEVVLCLTYLDGGDSGDTVSAYHATQGTCVIGQLGTDKTWFENNCVIGDYVVVARLTGTTDNSQCHSYSNMDLTETYTAGYSQLDVVLCLSVNYPDAAGHATVNTCLATSDFKVGSFENVPCSEANVVVTGRINKYSDGAYCGSYGWTSWHSGLDASITYTVCFRRL
ncbi:serine/threonine-protein kinase [Actinospica robiniae]|uniref:serine/threonine-protein kinase n=1 Tax=Actinospica robiniae TaxID=304901 RepID=UPI00041868D4|nr:serine/threonine-protein kinase [Actinospica robiniae]